MASEYGWTLEYIMEKVYPEDYFLLSRQIRLRLIDKTLMDIRVTSYPHFSEDGQKDFVEGLTEQADWFRGDPAERVKMDRGGLQAFKSRIKTESRFGKVRQKGDKKDDGVLE